MLNVEQIWNEKWKLWRKNDLKRTREKKININLMFKKNKKMHLESFDDRHIHRTAPDFILPNQTGGICCLF